MFKYLVISFIIIGTVGLSFAMDSENIELDKPFMINLNQTLSVDILHVTFLEVEDSRCPSDVTCIWEGRASVILGVYDPIQYQTITLTTSENSTSYFGSYEIKLIDILPYPISTKDISKEYVATISVSKSTPEIVLPPLKQSKNGVESDLIKCKSSLILIIKNTDGSPACVKPESKTRLLERGWTINEI